MYSKNYLEMKSAITDGLHDFCKKNQSCKKESETTSVINLIKNFSLIFPIVSLFLTCIAKFISMGYVWYFNFDFEHYDFTLSNFNWFVFIFSLLACVIGFFACCSLMYIVLFFSNYLKFLKKTWVQNLIIFLGGILIVLFFYTIVLLIIKEWNSGILFLVVSIFSFLFTYMLFPSNNYIKKQKHVVMIFLLITISFSFIVAVSQFQTEYEAAKNNKDFKIIELDNTNYVVITDNAETFSAYECEYNEDSLVIYVNIQKTLNSSEQVYEIYHFENINTVEHIKYFDKERGIYDYYDVKYDLAKKFPPYCD